MEGCVLFVREAVDKSYYNTLVIAHRLSTISKDDRILVLDGGRVVESGRHEELIELPGGVYSGLFRDAERSPCGSQIGLTTYLRFLNFPSEGLRR